MIESGKYYIFPFFEKINGVYRNEYPIPELTEYKVDGTIKLEFINMARHKDLIIDVVMAKIKTVLKETIKESNLPDVWLVEEKFNTFVKDKINQKQKEDPANNCTMVLNMIEHAILTILICVRFETPILLYILFLSISQPTCKSCLT